MKFKYVINPPFESLSRFVQELPQKFDHEGMIIYDSRNTVGVFKQGGTKVAVKRFRRARFLQRFGYTFMRPSKPKRAYEYALKLLEMGIRTPEPIACIEEYHWGLFYRGYLVSAYCGDPDARVLREECENYPDLLEALVQFLVRMHEKGFLHGDTNLSNFLYHEDKNEPAGYCITTIDINRSSFVESPTKEQCLTNLKRVTHVRPVLRKIVSRYAELRGWDAAWAVDYVMKKLDAFEKRNELKKKVKKK